MNDSKDQTIS